MKAPAAKSQSQGLQFIVTTPSQGRSQAQQRLVRSHVARHKVRRKEHRPLPSWTTRDDDVSSRHESQQQQLPVLLNRTRFDCEFSWVHFSEDMKPYICEDIIRCLTIVRVKLYPDQICLQSEPEDPAWVGLLLSDPVYLHSMVFSTEAYFDISLGRARSLLTQFHFVRTLGLLQERIAVPGDPLAIADQTIMAVVTLALAAQAVGDGATMENHIQGLRKMVDLRGGFGSLKSMTHELPAKICRVDLGFALRFGQSPMFFRDSVSWSRYVPDSASYRRSTIDSHKEIHEFVQSLQWRLVNVWLDLQQFSISCNLACQTEHRLTYTTFSEIMISVLYRLLYMPVDGCPINDAVRVCMIAFTAAIFLQWQYFEDGREHVGNMLNDALSKLRVLSVDVPPRILLWMLMISSVTSPNNGCKQHERWLDNVIKRTGIHCWDEARRVFKSMIWIDVLNNETGEEVFENAISRSNK